MLTFDVISIGQEGWGAEEQESGGAGKQRAGELELRKNVSTCCGITLANQIRGYRNQVRLRGLQSLQPAQAGFVFVDAVSNRPSLNHQMYPPRNK